MGFIEWLKGLFQGPAPKAASTSAAAQAKPREMYVFVTLKGKKFHYTQGCPGLHNAKTFKMDLSKARKGGYMACDKCCYGYLHY